MNVRDAHRIKTTEERRGKRRLIRNPENVLDFDPARIGRELNPGTSNRRIMKAFHQILNTVIEQELTPRQREIVQMYYYDGQNMREISEKLGVTPSTVTRTLYRGKSTIRRSLKYCILLLRTSIEEEADDDD